MLQGTILCHLIQSLFFCCSMKQQLLYMEKSKAGHTPAIYEDHTRFGELFAYQKADKISGKDKYEACFLQLEFLFFCYNKKLMNKKGSLAIILMTMLLASQLNGVRWQGMGSGMNNTVITEIWSGLESNINGAIPGFEEDKCNGIVTGISDRLNARWGQAWNVMMFVGGSQNDAIIYGYAFNNQWMWYNGVPYANQEASNMVTIIVWKDYNCRDWKNIADGFPTESSSLTETQKSAIRAELQKMTASGITNDVWGTTFTMMETLRQNSAFSSGGFTALMAQDGLGYLYGRICRVGDNFYNSLQELNNAIIAASAKGYLYLFQTR